MAILFIPSALLVIFAFLVLYLLSMLLFYNQPSHLNTIFHLVSIVIPYRNEAENLPKMLQSLRKQDYQGTFEIILVNDQSTDDYVPVINAFKDKNVTIIIKVISSQFNPSLHLTSKQQALDNGVAHASHDWIAFTDADMHLHSNWLSSLINSTTDDVSLVYGHTVIKKGKNSLFERFQSFQLEFLFTTAFAFHTSKLPGSCMGNNLLFAKKMYQDIGGQKGIGYSIVEDLDLLKNAGQKKFKAAPVIPFYPTAETQPCKTFGQFFHQALRWLKGGFKQPFSLLPVLFLLGYQNIILILALFQIFPLPVLYLSLANIMILFLFTLVGFRKIGSKESVLLFPLYYIFITIQTIFMIIPVLIITPVWKKRQI